MTCHALEIPDDPATLASWLEGQIAGGDLGRLAAELQAVNGAVEAHSSLSEVMGDHLHAVRAGGLNAAPLNLVRALLNQPHLLIALQDDVLTAESEFWDRALRSDLQLAAIVQRGEARLMELIEPKTASPRAFHATKAAARQWLSHPMFAQPGIVSLATAAVVLLCAMIFHRASPEAAKSGQPWGWNNPGLAQGAEDRQGYLLKLADGADQWFQERPATPRDLARRIGQFRQGCSGLILGEHPLLSAAEQAWLVGKCRAWAARLDAHLAEVEACAPVSTVRDQVDATIRKLIETLRARAAERGISRLPSNKNAGYVPGAVLRS